MVNVMRISKDRAEKYQAHKKQLVNANMDVHNVKNGGRDVDIDVSVLSNFHWLSQNVMS